MEARSRTLHKNEKLYHLFDVFWNCIDPVFPGVVFSTRKVGPLPMECNGYTNDVIVLWNYSRFAGKS